MRSHHALHHGAAWYPELWPESVWQEDLRQMQAHGLTCVRIAEFAWSRLEPQDGVIDLVWLRRAMDLCHAHGLGVVLCTPTATPPLWVLARHPDCLWTDRQGRQPIHGGRQHASYHHQGFRDLGVRITTLMARDLGRHPALIAWQTDNEYGGHQDGDTGPHAAARWRVWLEQRYGSIAALNQAWRTDLWSQHYASFTEVPTARTPLTTGHHNYALEADYRRFISDMVRSFNAEQCAAIRAHSDRPITHNSISCIDDGALARDLDFCSVDVYQPPDRIWDPFLHFDSMRHLGRRRGGFWVMETAPECKMKPHGPWPDGWLANFAFATWVSGGEGFSYWLWRQQPTGVEINHPSVLHACGRPTLGATDVAEVGTVRRQLEPLLRGWSPAPAEVALVRCERNGRMLQDNGISTFGGSYSWWECMHLHHRALLEAGVAKDIVYDDQPFDAYRLVITNSVMAVSPTFLAHAKRFVENGGVLVLGAHTGTRTEACGIPENAIQGDVETTFGFRAEHLAYLRDVPVELAAGGRGTSRWGLVAYRAQEGEETLGSYQHPRLSHLAWGVARRVGQGWVYVLGSELDAEATRRVHAAILDRHGITRQPQPWGTWVFPQRATDGRRAWAVINAGAEAVLTLPGPGAVDLLSGERFIGATLPMPAGSRRFLELSPA